MSRMILFILITFLLSQCDQIRLNKNEGQTPVAKVDDKYLYLEEMENIFPDNVTEKDSIDMANKFIEKWTKKQLLLEKANLNLPQEQKDVSRKIEDYRASLLIYRYEDLLIDEKMDTAVNQQQIKEYYREYKDNFRLKETIIMPVYAKIPKSAPDIDEVLDMYSSDEEEDVNKMIDYCNQYAYEFDYCDNKWLSFDVLQNVLPEKIEEADRFLKKHAFFQMQDSLNYYLVRLINIKVKGEVAPMTYVQSDIRSIILNKRRIEFIKNIENEIYKKAREQNKVEIY